jgi:hypothetical protein
MVGEMFPDQNTHINFLDFLPLDGILPSGSSPLKKIKPSHTSLFKPIIPNELSPKKKKRVENENCIDAPPQKKFTLVINSTSIRIKNEQDDIKLAQPQKINRRLDLDEVDLLEKSDQLPLTTNINHIGNITLKTTDPAVQTQINLITSSKEFLEASQQKKTYILSIISQITEYTYGIEDKLAELGILYYYLICKKNFSKLPLTQFRITEIVNQVEMYQNAHRLKCPSELLDLLPSGSHAYILRTLVMMIFTPNGVFNLGGCYAVKKMISSKLEKFLSKEECFQILKMVDRLIHDEKFLNFFKVSFPIKEEFQELILIDMKLPKIEITPSEEEQKKFSFVDVRWSVLLALFTPLGQLSDIPNCFSIASLYHLMNEQPEVVVEILFNVLKTGNLSLEGRSIPISLLLENIYQYEKDFKLKINYNDLKQLTGFILAKDCIEIQTQKPQVNNTNSSINDSMDIEFGDNTEYAKKILASLKFSFVQNLLVSIFQFIPLNTTYSTKVKDRSYKEAVISLMVSDIENRMNSYDLRRKNEITKNKYNDFIFKFTSSLNEKLFFVDFYNRNIVFNNNRVEFDHHKVGFEVSSDPSEYKKFRDERRLCILINDRLIPIDSISKLKYHLRRLAIELNNDLNLKSPNSEIKNFISVIKSDEFEIIISKLLYKTNKVESSLEPDEYLKSDSLFFIQDGSNVFYLEKISPFKELFKTTINFQSDSVSTFFTTLCSHVSQHALSDPKFLNKIAPLELMECESHVFNLIPFSFKDYWNGNSQTVIEDKILKRAKKNSILTEHRMQEILDFSLPPALSTSVFEQIKHQHFELTKFLEVIKNITNHVYDRKIDNVLSFVFDKINLKKANDLAKAILFKIIEENDIVRYLPLCRLRLENMKKIGSYSTPYALSSQIHETLLLNPPANLKSIHEIENCVRELFELPEIVQIANLNYIGENLLEKLKFEYLSIKFDYSHQDLRFCKLKNGYVLPLDEDFVQELLRETNLMFSK